MEYWAYPLEWGATLSNHDWMPLLVNKLLSSKFVAKVCAEDRRADLGTALILWSESLKQNPAGTLPDDDVELARLAGYGPDLAGWRAARDGALYGWRPCEIDGERFGSGGDDCRLGHPVIADICMDMYKRKRGRDQSRETANLNTLKSRVRTKLRSIKQTRMAENGQIVDGVAIWLRDGGHYCTDDNVRAALEALQGVPKVVGMHSGDY
ncbi:DUF1376 domain-containing protein [Rhodobacteraceae bacterium]|nr:DUF1376 domain-containing protein [Paracoccaceae bacterium]